MNLMKMTRSGKEEVNVDDFSHVASTLKALDGIDNNYVLLSKEEEYVFVAGRQEKLVMIIKKGAGNSSAYFAIGLSKRNEEVLNFPYGDKKLAVQHNELLAREDAQLLCRCFFDNKAFPPAYNERSISKPLL